MAMLQRVATPFGAPSGMEAMQSNSAMDPPVSQTLRPQQLHTFNQYLQVPGQSFAPSSFMHQDTAYETMEQDGSPMDPSAVDGLDTKMSTQHRFDMSHPLPPSAEKFRFQTTLNAATAMIKQADETPITYLNKGQAYSLSVVDTL